LLSSNREGRKGEETGGKREMGSFDSVYLVGGAQSQQKVTTDLQAKAYLEDAYKHNKFIAIGSGPVPPRRPLLPPPLLSVDDFLVQLVSPYGFE
ncbi:hypothetical protein, partial [Sphingobacterium daejeonense]|uniref:hypothetical protein n=1 Tax=Sphingobacterium daejeonense TaxID=371142 RepID=UPI003D3132C8